MGQGFEDGVEATDLVAAEQKQEVQAGQLRTEGGGRRRSVGPEGGELGDVAFEEDGIV